MKTYSLKPTDIARQWYVLDASEVPLGRLATKAATLLGGKGKPTFTPHIDGGDYVVVINTDKLLVSGNKLTDKKYYRHSGYPGALRQQTLEEAIVKDSRNVVLQAIEGMLPANKLRAGRLARLKLYSGQEHQHEAQKPQTLNLKSTKKDK